MNKAVFNQIVSPSSERNKQAILDVISTWLSKHDNILEVGSNTAQHAIFFTEHLDIVWQCSEQQSHLENLKQWIKMKNTRRLPTPIELDVNNFNWHALQYDTVFTANTLHIMDIKICEEFLNNVHLALKPTGKFIIYGPFEYQDKPLCPSNKEFNIWLENNFIGGGIKSFNSIEKVLKQHGFKLIADVDMPANNQLLLWQLTS